MLSVNKFVISVATGKANIKFKRYNAGKCVMRIREYKIDVFLSPKGNKLTCALRLRAFIYR